MKVLLIDVNYKTGSTGQIVFDLYSYINKKGDCAAVCYGRGKKIKERNVFKFGLDWETRIHALLTRLTGQTGCFSFFSTKRLIRFIDSFKPDVIHIHELHAYFLNIVPFLEYLKKKNIPIVHTLHCEFSYTGKCGHADDCIKWKTECNHCHKTKGYPASLFFDCTRSMYIKKRDAFSGFDKLVVTTPSEWLSQRARQSFLNSYEILTINNGIDTSVFKPHEANLIRLENDINEKRFIILAVAPNIMSQSKGGNYVLECAKRLDSDKFFFILIGADKVIENVQSNVLVLPKIKDKRKLSDYYSAADVFLLCSDRESFSLTCAESLCCGTPVVGFKCGAPETIFSNLYAHFVEYGNINSLIKELSRVLANPPNTADLVSYAQSSFSTEVMTENYYQLYKKASTNN